MASIFLSHSHADKAFVRKLAQDIHKHGHAVWIDEAEIQIGDSLVEKIREGLDIVDYVGAVLSKSSVESEWVKKELDVAMNVEIDNKRVKVLPLLLEDVELPGFLKGKMYADFKSEEQYADGLSQLLNKLDSTIEIKSDKKPSDIESELRERLQQAQQDVYKERMLREKLEHQTEILQKLVKDKPAPATSINIGSIGTVGNIGNISGNATVNIDQSTTYNQNDLVAIKELIREIQTQRADMERKLSQERLAELESSIKDIQTQLDSNKPNNSILKGALLSLKSVLEGTAGNVLGGSIL